jgi:hypothetical protein
MESSFPRKREPRATGNPPALHLTSSWFEMDRLPAFTAPDSGTPRIPEILRADVPLILPKIAAKIRFLGGLSPKPGSPDSLFSADARLSAALRR